MSLKNLKPITIKRNPSLPDGHQLFPIADKWAELLPERVPLQFSIFRYLGFYVACTKNGKSTVVRSRAVAALRVTIQNEDKVVFNERVNTAFPNGVYYVQDIRLENPGVHTVCVTVEGGLADDLAPLVLKTQVFEFMELHECPDLEKGAYQPLREFVLNCIKNGHREQLRDDSFLETYVRTKKHSLRNMDARWWLRAFVQHTLDREERQRLLILHAAKYSCRTTHKRKQDHPSRTADKKEHDNLFARRKRDWKRVRAGDLRMFTTEPLHAGATTTVYSSKEMFRQLSLYAQV
ncbi:hypothetical protein F442_04284 [Phytophthora nicotianae P10297]|uniref:Uncharacterized protein n=5 Tax=Phytophthora nicotianae TaxID=4792 RepID=W2QK23_PHYN3|nr:hypothetical protein PPTG_08312 [Phytophthora nicotianae INRA-310]ETI52559.1 hypothetical protein F443_04318 [Phytophthora nicotianae P1569]ETK92461.1 hypothetical protein L915_04172 [Phytophthora nicotianae]ETO76833.1 hypothetical protein F444_07757 [Phytophthora nicotianae P1976]ETP50310.1 hypothetical protein F442_04284 [Phytophthora nicotianae P10297]ETL99016.1 hypothetical protein L917_04026 [Phytophthora nicotianae]